jgi:hypothetical protein
MNPTLRLAAAALALPLLLTAGCGMVAAPQPPSLKLPEPVTDLSAVRTGDQVELHWTMPKRTTDKVPLVGQQKVKVCRRVGSEPCEDAGHLLAAPQSTATFTDHLPAALISGVPRPLIYTVELQNQAGRTAGPSNPALTAAGSAPAQITGLHAQARADGIALTWTPTDTDDIIRLHRTLADKAPPKNSPLPLQQTLEFTGKDQGSVLDPDAALDHIYTYTAQRVAKLTLEDKPVEIAGDPSESVTINARDIFPPAVPTGLQAIADPQARAIDLSWQPNTEADLAGYAVYRGEAGSNAPPTRISPPTAQPAPSFHDPSALPGHTYDYSVSAIDRDGNESPRSAEVEESLPQQVPENPA